MFVFYATCTMLSFPSSLDKTNAIFLEFVEDLDNLTEGSSSTYDNSSESNGVCVQKTFPIRCLKWANVGREYIKVVKGDLQRFFVFDFNDQALNSFVEHQMLSTFKEFWGDCHRHFKKYDPKEARANHPRYWWDIMRIDTTSMIITRVAEDAHNQMLKLKSQPIPKGSQQLSRDEICETVLGRRSSYSKGLSWGPKPKVCKTTSASSATTSTQSMIELQLRVELDKAKRAIEEQTRKQDMLASRGSSSDVRYFVRISVYIF
ncbi:CACTA en-spm transposon protein [Cucumis melo var. makuwa]|uniref:CACTA en-spm transposon protein n=1 Tax=Cucumis melo var. makuwa TaxID=1194695 RepID=A0A5A7TPQ3_CUCMM|nr:CACTA en-spm transposon protein [Cucumis melo var. makuwa]